MTIHSSAPLDDLTPHQLIREVRQIAEQYAREVTTARRSWPKSVRDRVLALDRLGVPRNRIGKECGIPSATIFLWCGKQAQGKKRGASGEAAAAAAPERPKKAGSASARFLPLPPESDPHSSIPKVGIQIERLPSRAVANSELEPEPGQPMDPSKAAAELHVVLPGGVEVRGLTSLEQVVALYRRCRA